MAHFSEQQGVVGVHAYYLDEKTKQIYTRNFAPLYGIDEESATGTSNGGLVFYLWKKGLLESDIEQVIIQGEAMNQASRIMVKIESSIPRVHVGGTVILELIDTNEKRCCYYRSGSGRNIYCGRINKKRVQRKYFAC